MYLHEKEFRACFLLSSLEYTDVFPIENEYCGIIGCCPDKRWFLFRTAYGLIKIGWRKKVIHIDWKDTGLSCTDITKDNVTVNANSIHAWGYGKCVEYLTVLSYKLAHKERTV